MTPGKHTPETSWNSPRFRGIQRPYTRADVDRLRGTVHIEHSLARAGAEKYWKLLKNNNLTQALGALNGDQAAEMAAAGLPVVYVSESPVTGYAATTCGMSDQVRRVNRSLLRADQAAHSRRQRPTDWMLPIVAQGDTGECTFECTRNLIEAGAAAIHFDDLHTDRRNSNMEKTVIPTEEAIQRLVAARLAADVMGVPTVLIARTDAESATYITNDHDPRDRRFLIGERTPDGKYMYRGGLQAAIDRALALAPYADMLWCEMSDLNKEKARRFADAIHAQFPRKLLAFNCSPSFHWRAKLNEDDIACFQRDLAAMGYRFQFISLAGHHTLNLSMYQFAKDYLQSGMTAYSQVQQLEQDMAKHLGHRSYRPEATDASSYDEVVTRILSPDHNPVLRKKIDIHPLDTQDYNGDEATERMPMPHLYPSLDAVPMAAAAD